MKLFFTLLFFISSASYARYPQAYRERARLSEQARSSDLNHMQNQLYEDMTLLLSTLVDEATPKERQMEILGIISEITLINNDIREALEQFVSQGVTCDKKKLKNCVISDTTSLKAQSELIRRRIQALAKSSEDERVFYVNLAADVAVAFVGGVLLFIPVVGETVGIPLLLVRFLGGAQGLIGGSKALVSIRSRFGKDGEPSLLALSDLASVNVFAFAMVQILSENPELVQVLPSGSERDIVEMLKTVIGPGAEDFSYNTETRIAAVQALGSFPTVIKLKRSSTAQFLMDVMDSEEEESLRRAIVKSLGQMGEGYLKVSTYLKEKGMNTNESDDLRLMALMEWGRNPSQFPNSIEILAEWLDSYPESEPIKIEVEIPLPFLESLLSVTKEGTSNEHIIVLEELIRSGRLNLEMKIKSSETLSRWDESLKTKAFLRAIYSQDRFFEDIAAYVEELFQENQEAFDFLQKSIADAKKVPNFTQSIEFIESDIKELQEKYPNQLKTAKKLKIFLKSYKKIWEFINK